MVTHYKGIEVHYEMQGSGDVLVLLHGFLECLAMWRPLQMEFKNSHCVLTIDLPGHGKTGCLGYVHSMETMAEVVLHVLNINAIDKGRFIGHSMGGYVALAIADMAPKRVDGLCLMNSTYEADTEERQELRKRSVELAKINYEQLIRLSFSNLFAPESKVTHKNEYAQAMKLALKTPVQGYIAAQNGMLLRKDHLQTFLKAKGPKAVVIGKKDSIVNTKAITETLAETDIKICHLSGGHMSHIEDLYDLSLFLLRFIEF
jgi:pimeloyl-ACP methyl ester carboxylesterase